MAIVRLLFDHTSLLIDLAIVFCYRPPEQILIVLRFFARFAFSLVRELCNAATHLVKMAIERKSILSRLNTICIYTLMIPDSRLHLLEHLGLELGQDLVFWFGSGRLCIYISSLIFLSHEHWHVRTIALARKLENRAYVVVRHWCSVAMADRADGFLDYFVSLACLLLRNQTRFADWVISGLTYRFLEKVVARCFMILVNGLALRWGAILVRLYSVEAVQGGHLIIFVLKVNRGWNRFGQFEEHRVLTVAIVRLLRAGWGVRRLRLLLLLIDDWVKECIVIY